MKNLQAVIVSLVIQWALCSPAAANTSIIVVRTPGVVYLGADSRTITEGPKWIQKKEECPQTR